MNRQQLETNKAFGGHSVVLGILATAKWHRRQSQDFLNKRVNSMYQHEKQAIELEKTAAFLERDATARAGLSTGEFTAVCTGFCKESGRYIQVQNAQGWKHFWSEGEPSNASA